MMEKALILALLALSLTAGGPGDSAPLPLEEVPDDYSLEQAKLDGCVVHENGDITNGAASFLEFAQQAARGEKCAVRLVDYYTLDDPFQYSEEPMAEIIDHFPMMFVEDLSFDGKTYTLRRFDGDQEVIRQFPYMKKFEGPAEQSYLWYSSYVRYVLTNDNSVTWEKLLSGDLQGQSGEYVSVFTDLVRAN